MPEKKHRLKGLMQQLYITWSTFMANDLFTYASAGAYSFLMSALPVLLMVLVVLVRFFNTSPDTIRDMLNNSTLFSESLDISTFLNSVMSIKSVGIFEIIIGLSVFSMARSFFVSIQHGMQIIWRKRGKGKPIKENLLLIAGEVLLVILIVVMVIVITAGNAFFKSALSRHLLTPLLYSVVRNLFVFAPLAIIFLFLFLVYYYTPRTRPGALQSLISAAACTVSLILVQLVFASFINMSRYNLIYGILSNVIVILLQVYMFFFLFLFYAQFLYVVQYFESFLLARLYLLPAYDDPDPFRQIERMLFIQSPRFYRRYAVRRKAGDVIFVIGEESTELYFTCQGYVRLNMPNRVMDIETGRVFGEFSSIIGGTRTGTAVALTDVLLLRLPAAIFQETIEVDGEMSRRTLQMIADYVRKKNTDPLSTDL